MEQRGDAELADRLCDSSINHRVSARTTRTIVTFFLLAAHVLFLYGQTAIMWYLFSEVRADVELHADSLDAKLAFRALKLQNPSNITINFHQTIEAFTYWDAIRGLWTGHTGPVDPRYQNPGPGPWGKVSAILLIFFSAFWPHAKLLGLNYQYHRKVRFGDEESRTTTLYWLDTFGKWSLADVFVICTLLAVLNLDMPLQAPKILDALGIQLRQLANDFTKDDTVREVSRAVCQQLFFPDQTCEFRALKDQTLDDMAYAAVSNVTTLEELASLSGRNARIDCSNLRESCPRCACILETVFPTVDLLILAVDRLLRGVRAEGDLIAVLRVAGRSGIYIFCLATLTSLSLSWIIDAIDHRTRSKRKIGSRTVEEGMFFEAINQARSREDRESVSLVRRGTLLSDIIEHGASAGGSNAVIADGPREVLTPLLIAVQTPHVMETAAKVKTLHPARWMIPVCVLALTCAILGAFLPMMRRRVPGSIMNIVRDDLEVDLTREYSILHLVELTGVAGGPDYLLCFAFGLFVLVGPIFRGFIICLLAFVPLPSRPQRKLAFFTNTLGVFSGWDVLLVAFALVRLEMPRITQGIVSPSLPICKLLHQLGKEPYCISIEFLFIYPEFLIVPIATICLVFSATRIVRVAFFTFDPFGDGYQGAPRSVASLVG